MTHFPAPPTASHEPTVIINNRHPRSYAACDAFWSHWKTNGETHKHGYYESTWGAINAALRLVGVRDSASPVPQGEQLALAQLAPISDERINELWHLKVGTPATIAVRIFARALLSEAVQPSPAPQEQPEPAGVALGAPPDMVALLRDPNFSMSGGSEFALEIVAALGVRVGAPGDTDAERAAWLADKIVAGGDYAKEAAHMLRRWPTNSAALPATAREAHRLADEFYNGTAEKDWPMWAQEAVVILERAAPGVALPAGCAHSWHDFGQLGGRNVSWCPRCDSLAFTGNEPDGVRACVPAQPLPKWEPCNEGCDPEFNGCRSRSCKCPAALAALGVALPVKDQSNG